MEFRSLKAQYDILKNEINKNIEQVISEASFISGHQVNELEDILSEYVGVKHCITCANGTDALTLAMMAWGIGVGDAVFVPDFTFFSSGEVVSLAGATPIFVDVDADTFNIDPPRLEEAIKEVNKRKDLNPRAIVAVDLFGQPAGYSEIRKIANKYNLYVLEDGAQGFGGKIGEKKACSFGDISTTSFFPMKPLGCYGDGGAVFTDNDEWAALIRSYCVHGKGSSKYDNVRIGLNSRLDTLQAAILLAKFPKFVSYELDAINDNAAYYTEKLGDFVKVPTIKEGYYSSWAQYTIQLSNKEQRDGLQRHLKEYGIPTFVYYPKPMHKQAAFENREIHLDFQINMNILCDTVLSLPISPYISNEEMEEVCRKVVQGVK